MQVKETILLHIQQIAEEENTKLPALTDDLMLMKSGLDSMCFAILVTRLQDVLGIDPFSASDDVYYPVTLGEFIRFYEDAAK
jgi:hypothetical protein